MRKSDGKALAAFVVLLAIIDLIIWLSLRDSSPSSAATLTPAAEQSSPTTTPASPSETPSPSAAPVVALPGTTGRALRYAIVSDSIGSGVYASSFTTTYPALVSKTLQVRGSTSQQGFFPRDNASSSTDVTVPDNLDLAIVELGTDERSTMSASDFAAKYTELLSQVRVRSPRAVILCAGTWSGDGAAYDAVIRVACDTVSGSYVSLAAAYADGSDRGPAGQSTPFGVSDDVAPNDNGHRAIASALLTAVGVQLLGQ